METPRDWHEDDRFWELAAPIMFDDTRWLTASTDIEAVLRLTGTSAGASVLDLCCGPGRHSIELSRRGLQVTGVDRTKMFLDMARSKAGSLPAEWVLADARTFVRPEAFDLAINLYTSFGYFDNPAEDEMVARNLAQSLKPGGKLVMQLIGKEVAAGQYVAREWQENDDMILLDERHIVPPFAAIENRWTIIRDGKIERLGFVVRLYSASELEGMLLRAGFNRVRFFGTLDGLPYNENARRLVAMATKGL